MPPKKETHYADSVLFQSPHPSQLPIPVLGPNGKLILLSPKKAGPVKNKAGPVKNKTNPNKNKVA